MDVARWWNTKGQLGPLGAAVLRRGFPRTHYFAQARSVFAVAAHRCREVFNPPDSVTLWQLPATVEEEFDTRWEHWLDHAADWNAFFQELATVSSPDLAAALEHFNLVGEHALNAFGHLRRAAEGRSVPLPVPFRGSEDDVTLLALAFARGGVGALAVPFTKMGDT
jgi:hypothetical protein